MSTCLVSHCQKYAVKDVDIVMDSEVLVRAPKLHHTTDRTELQTDEVPLANPNVNDHNVHIHDRDCTDVMPVVTEPHGTARHKRCEVT
jgi:hypothetical protein